MVKKRIPHNKITFSEEKVKKIINLYNTDLMSGVEIGKIFGVDSGVIFRLLRENKIDTSPSHKRRRLFESGKMKPTKGFTGRKHTEESKSLTSKKLKGRKFSEETLKKMSIANKGRKMTEESKRKMSETRLKKIAKGDKDIKWLGNGIDFPREKENNPNWRGGKSFEPYGFDFCKKLKKAIRKRDNHICMACGVHEERLSRLLDIHHINYDKTCNLQQNLVSLCTPCHSKTNANRPHWTKFFQSLLSERYGYKYNEGEIVVEI